MAGVTHSTVSRALRDSPLVNRETVQRIQRIASEAGYRPSAAARSLVNRRSDTIGVVVTNIADPFVAGVVSGIEEMADQNGLSVFLANSNAEPEREVRVARKFEERRWTASSSPLPASARSMCRCLRTCRCPSCCSITSTPASPRIP